MATMMHNDPSIRPQIDSLCERFEQQLRRGENPDIEALVQEVSPQYSGELRERIEVLASRYRSDVEDGIEEVGTESDETDIPVSEMSLADISEEMEFLFYCSFRMALVLLAMLTAVVSGAFLVPNLLFVIFLQLPVILVGYWLVMRNVFLIYESAPRFASRLVWTFSSVFRDRFVTPHDRVEALFHRRYELSRSQGDVCDLPPASAWMNPLLWLLRSVLAINIQFIVVLVMAIFGVVVIIWAVTVVVGGI